jgi:oxalate decarboxylase/phosphoglucose isomerase-like protein (cupin superfamily)
VQEVGDMIYVPALWGHTTLNERQSVGVAYELFL